MASRDTNWLANAAQERGVQVTSPAISVLEGLQIQSFEALTDTASARSLLEHQKQSRKVENAPSRSIKVLEKFSKINSNFAYEDYRGAICDFLAAEGSPGVLHCLLREFWQENVKSAKTKLSKKRDEIADQDKHLFIENLLEVNIHQGKHKADKNWLNIISLLVFYSRKECLNKHLVGAIESKDVALTRILLQGEADPNTCAKAICGAITQNNEELVRLVLRSRVSWHESLLGDGLLFTMSLPSTHILQLLLSHNADVNYQSAASLLRAIDTQRINVLLMLLTAQHFPTSTNLDLAVGHLFKGGKNMDKSQRCELLEALLRAGAAGDNVSRALIIAVRQEDWDAGLLLVENGASTNYEDGAAFMHVARNRKLQALRLFEGHPVGSRIATRAFESVSKIQDLASSERLGLFHAILKQGAQGKPVHDALTVAVRDRDVQATKLLLDNNASVDHDAAEALRVAITTAQWYLVDLMLKYKPNQDSLCKAFIDVQSISRPERQRLTEQLLRTGVQGDVVDQALCSALSENLQDRDYTLIQTLVESGAGTNQQNGTLVRSLVLDNDETGMKILLKGRCSNETLCAALAPAKGRNKRMVPIKYIKYLLEAGAKGNTVSEMLIDAVNNSDPDLARLLLKSSKPDVNFRQGAVVQMAATLPVPTYFDLIMQYGKLDLKTKKASMLAILQLTQSSYSNYYRCEKFHKLLPLIQDLQFLSDCVGSELDTQIRTREDDPQILGALLDKGAEIRHGIVGKALHAKAFRCLERILKAKPPQKDVDAAFLQPCDHEALELLLSTGVSSDVKGEVLLRATNATPRDMEWIAQLLDYGAPVDFDQGAVVISAAAKQPDETLLSLLITKRPAPMTLEDAFVAAGKLPQLSLKVSMYRILLEAGVSGESVDKALVAAAESDTQDLELSKSLLEYRASVDYNTGEAILTAIRQGHVTLLTLLVAHSPSETTLSAAFDSAMRIENVSLQEKVYSLVLNAGFRGKQRDEALVQAASLGSSGLQICGLLLEFKASVNHQKGAAICAVVSASPCYQPLLRLLLQHTPSQKTIGTALSSCLASKAGDRSPIMEMCLSKSTGAIPGLDAILAKLVSLRLQLLRFLVAAFRP